MENTAIVIVAYDRESSLRRLLKSLEKGRFLIGDIPLIISIDGGGDPAVERATYDFQWGFGPKRVIHHDRQLGLKEHVLTCGDLVYEFGSVIMIEDDLVVGPDFYTFATAALEHYRDDERVSQISLYSFRQNEFVQRPFYPLETGYSTYFVQSGSSWGQAWSVAQWGRFRQWLTNNQEQGLSGLNIPHNVRNWPDSSWKKWFNGFLTDTNTFAVVPYSSYTTNFGDDGTHHKSAFNRYQVTLGYSVSQFLFPTLDEADCVYDGFFELESNRLTKILLEAKAIDAETHVVSDIYGLKPLESLSDTDIVLTSRKPSVTTGGYGDSLNPPVFNAVYGLSGNRYHLARVRDIVLTSENKTLRDQLADEVLKYPTRLLLRVLASHVRRKLFAWFRGSFGSRKS